MGNRERVEAEARELYPASSNGPRLHHRVLTNAERRAFIAGRTVARDRYVEAARVTGISTYQAREYLRAAGLLIEREDDE